MSSHRKLKKKEYIYDMGGVCYKQEVVIEQPLFDMIQQSIHDEINNNYPRAKKYNKKEKRFLQPLNIIGTRNNLSFMNKTTLKFINLILKMKLFDINTYLIISEDPKCILPMEEFIEIFEPITNTDTNNILFDIEGKDLAFIRKVLKVSPRKIWTLMDSDNGLVIVCGYHLLNRVKYIITKDNWIDCNNLVLYYDGF